MTISSFVRVAAIVTASAIAVPAHALGIDLLQSRDLINVGDKLITFDGKLEWLDLTETAGRSYNDVSGQLGSGGEFDGWRYATRDDVTDLWDAAGGNSAEYNNGWSASNNGLFDRVAAHVGDLQCDYYGCPQHGDGQSYWLTADEHSSGHMWMSRMYDDIANSSSPVWDYMHSSHSAMSWAGVHPFVGSALVRESPVSEPTSVALFALGLAGLRLRRARGKG